MVEPFRSLLRLHLKRCLTQFRVRLAAMRNDPPVTPFCVLGEARTGTNLLADLLRSHPDVSVAGEILNPYDPQGIRLWLRSRGAVLRHIRRSLRALEGKCRGAQIHVYHFRLHGIPLETVCKKLPELLFLVIYRRSLAEQFVSWKLAKESRHWVGTSLKAVHKSTCVVDPLEFKRWCEAVRDRYAEVAACGSLWQRAISLAYEDLCENRDLIMSNKVFPFLGLQPVPVHTKLRKQNPRPLQECVANYAEVADLLAVERLDIFEGR